MTPLAQRWRRALRPPAPDSAELAYRRGGLLALLACGLFVSVFTLVAQVGEDFSNEDRLALSVIILKNLSFIVWLWRTPQHFLTIGLAELFLEVGAAIYRLNDTLHSPPSMTGLGGYTPWMIVTYLAAFLVLPTRAALPVSLIQFTGLLLVGATFSLSPRTDALLRAALGNTLLQTYLVHATFIAFLTLQHRLLQHYIHALVNARQEATLAQQDPLTGLPNRRQLTSWVHDALPHVSHQPLSVVLFDLDHFKRVNDTYGHEVGDQTLQLVGQVLRRSLRQRDRAGRWGGEEFLILVDGDAGAALAVAERLREALSREGHPEVGPVTISCGVAQATIHEPLDLLLRRADEALYRAKHAGRNTVKLAA